jgi:hypothetical protein
MTLLRRHRFRLRRERGKTERHRGPERNNTTPRVHDSALQTLASDRVIDLASLNK